MPQPKHKSLTSHGYVILKSELSKEEEKRLVKELTVIPTVLPAYKDFVKPKPYKIYFHSDTAYYLPRYYATEKYGPPSEILVPLGDKINAKCKHEPMPYQLTAAAKLDQMFNVKNSPQGAGGVLSLPCGYGKCHGIDTEILMFDGSVKKVQDIVVGDKLMGDDSTPRNVLSLARGREMMYRVIPDNGTSYVVNESHILSLKNEDGNVIDMCLKDYINLMNNPLRGYRVPLNFAAKHTPSKPYETGLILDQISDVFKINERCVQREILAGIIDSRAVLQANGEFLLSLSESLTRDVIFVARCLGLGIRVLDSSNTVLYGNVPTKLYGNAASADDPLIVSIRVEQLQVDNYYGFSLDGNHRYLLADFQVTHNTFLALRTACKLGLKTLVVVNKECLMDQWIEAVHKFTTASVGILQRDKVEMNNDIVVAMIHSLCLKEYPEDLFKGIGLLILDEVHHTASETFCQALLKVRPLFTLGLSATPERRDGLSHVFYKYIGPLIHKERRQNTNQVIVKQIMLSSTSTHYQVLFMSNNTKNTSGMATALSQFPSRTKMLVYILKLLAAQGRTTLVLSSRREHLNDIKRLLDEEKVKMPDGRLATYGFYYGKQGSNKEQHKKMLEATAKCDIVLGTDAIAKEGLDIPSLNTLVFATPPGVDVEQAVGRILRKYHEKIYPMVVDIVDKTGNFGSHSNERNKWYKDEDYDVQSIKLQIYDDEAMNKYHDPVFGFLNTKVVKNQKLLFVDDDDSDSDSESKKKEETPGFDECMLERLTIAPKPKPTLKLKTLAQNKEAVMGKPKTNPFAKGCMLADEGLVTVQSKVKQTPVFAAKCILPDEVSCTFTVIDKHVKIKY